MQIELAERRNACPIVEKLSEAIAREIGALASEMQSIQQDVDERNGQDRSSATWMKYAWPLICGFVGIVLTLAFLHGKEVLTHGQGIGR